MKAFLSLVVTALMISPSFAGEPVPVPVPEGEVGTVELYHCVKVKDPDHMHPCAVPKIVMVKDPCACDDPCSCCTPKCVAVQICIPPCFCEEEVKCKKDGEKVTYDYGKYRVQITSRKGVVTIDYDN